MDLLADNNEAQRLGSNLPNIIDYIAKFEEHPDPTTCGVDYAAIYSYIATLSKVTHASFCLHCYLMY